MKALIGAGTVSPVCDTVPAPVECQYSDMECWSGADATVTAVILQRLPPHLPFTREAVRFRNPGWVRDFGAAYIVSSSCKEYASRPHDARHAWSAFSEKFQVTPTEKLRDFVGWGPILPSGKTAIAGLTFLHPERDIGHWVATIRLINNTFVRVDKDSTMPITGEPDAALWFWMLPDATTLIGGAKIRPAPTLRRLIKNIPRQKVAPPAKNRRRPKKKKPAVAKRPVVAKLAAAAVVAQVGAATTTRKTAARADKKTPEPRQQSRSARRATAKREKTVERDAMVAAIPATSAAPVSPVPPPSPTAPAPNPAPVPARSSTRANGATKPPPAFDPARKDARGRKSNAQNGAFSEPYSNAHLLGDVRDTPLVAMALLVRALAQGLRPDLIAPPRPSGTRALFQGAMWEALFKPSSSTVAQLRADFEKARDKTAGAAARSEVNFATTLRLMCGGLIALGFDEKLLKDATHSFEGYSMPLADRRTDNYPSVIVVRPTEDTVPHHRVTASPTARGSLEACILCPSKSSTIAYPAAAVRRRATTTSGPASQDSFIVQGLSSSATLTIGKAAKNMGSGGFMSFALVRLTKSGILATAAHQDVQAAISSKRIVPTVQPLSATEQAAMRASPAQTQEDFRLGPCLLHAVTHLKGDLFSKLVIHSRPTHSDHVMRGKCPAVRERHVAELRRLKRDLEPDLLQLPLDEAMTRHYQQRWESKKASGYQWASLHREMCNLHGALRDISLYTNFPQEINLGDSAPWSAALRYAKQQAQETAPERQVAATFEQVDEAAHLCKDLQVASALMFAWMSAGRLGDITQLRHREVEFKETTKGVFQVTFCVRRGKGVASSQPYTVSTLCPPHWHKLLKTYLDTFKSPDHFLFNRQNAQAARQLSMAITRALKAVNSTLTQRAMRRGALQALAADPTVTAATMMTFSGHKREETLRRYLDWGRAFANLRELGLKAAKNLFRRRNQPAGPLTTSDWDSDSSTDTTSTCSN